MEHERKRGISKEKQQEKKKLRKKKQQEKSRNQIKRKLMSLQCPRRFFKVL